MSCANINGCRGVGREGNESNVICILFCNVQKKQVQKQFSSLVVLFSSNRGGVSKICKLRVCVCVVGCTYKFLAAALAKVLALLELAEYREEILRTDV